MSKLIDNVRSIVLSYVRAVALLFLAGLAGGLTDGPSGRVLWSLGIAASWGAIPAALRAAQVFIDPLNTPNLLLSTVLSMIRMAVGTGLLYLVGPADTAGPAFHAFLLAVGAGAVRIAQEALDRTSPPLPPPVPPAPPA